MPSTNPRAGSKRDLMFQALFPTGPQKISFTGTSSLASAFHASCNMIRVFATKDCYIKFGDPSVVATTSDIFVPGGIIQFFAVVEGQQMAVIQDTDSGTLHLIEGAIV